MGIDEAVLVGGFETPMMRRCCCCYEMSLNRWVWDVKTVRRDRQVQIRLKKLKVRDMAGAELYRRAE